MKSLLAFILLSSPLAAYGASLSCPPHPGPFGRSAMTPDGSHLVCVVDAAVPGKYEAYAVDGVRDPWRLSPNMADDRDVIGFQIAPDSQRVAFLCDKRTWTEYDLWASTIDGQHKTQISQSDLPRENDVDNDFLWAGDRVVWRQGSVTTGKFKLWSAGVNGAGRMELAPFTKVERGFQILDGERVRFSADSAGMGEYEWYVVAASGGRIAEEIFADGFNDGTTGGWR